MLGFFWGAAWSPVCLWWQWVHENQKQRYIFDSHEYITVYVRAFGQLQTKLECLLKKRRRSIARWEIPLARILPYQFRWPWPNFKMTGVVVVNFGLTEVAPTRGDDRVCRRVGLHTSCSFSVTFYPVMFKLCVGCKYADDITHNMLFFVALACVQLARFRIRDTNYR